MAYKSKTLYTNKLKHQVTKDSIIYEQDLSTLGDMLNIIPNQVPVYSSSNLVITKSTEQPFRVNYKSNEWVENQFSGSLWTSDIIIDNDGTPLKYTPNLNYNDLQSFAYYGSCGDLIRSSINNILLNFPGEMYVINNNGVGEKFEYEDDGAYYILSGKTVDRTVCDCVIDNPFMVDIFSEYYDDDLVSNKNSFFTKNGFEKYEVIRNGVITPITNWKVFRVSKNCFNPLDKVAEVQIFTINNEVIPVLIYKIDNGYIYLTNEAYVDTHIRLKPKYINDFYNNLSYFEKILLNKDTKPLYKATFEVIREDADGKEYKIFEDFVFPIGKGGFNLGIFDPSYGIYESKLIEVANIYDEKYSDNLYRNIVHESIKNFDWSKGEFSESSEKIEKIMKILGRGFDSIKTDIDSIGFTNNVNYNDKNSADKKSLISLLESDGWNLKSIKSLNAKSYLLDGNNEKVYHTISGDIYDAEGYYNEFYQNEEKYYPYNIKENQFVNKCCEEVAISGSYMTQVVKYIIYPPYKFYLNCDNKLLEKTNDGSVIEHEVSVVDGNEVIVLSGKTYQVQSENKIIYKTNPYSSNDEYTSNDVEYEFLKRLKLNSKNILRKKGTITSIEEVLGLFNLKSSRFINSRSNETAIPDYTINEYTLVTKPIVDLYDKKKSDYTINWYNTTKNYNYDFNIPYIGLPVQVSYESSKTRRFLTPYFDKKSNYDGETYYQMYGGWLKKERFLFGDKNEVILDEYFTRTLRNIREIETVDDLTIISPYKLHDNFYVEVKKLGNYIVLNGDAYEIKTEYLTFNNNPTYNTPQLCSYVELEIYGGYFNVGDLYYHDTTIISNPCLSNDGSFNSEIDANDYPNSSIIKVYLYKIDDNGIKQPVNIYSETELDKVKIDIYQILDDAPVLVTESEIIYDNPDYSNYWYLENKENSDVISIKDSSKYVGWERLPNYDTRVKYLKSIKTVKTGNNPHSDKLGYDNGEEYLKRFETLFLHSIENDMFDETCYDNYEDEVNALSGYGFTNLFSTNGDVNKIIDTKIHAFCDIKDTRGNIEKYGYGNNVISEINCNPNDKYPNLANLIVDKKYCSDINNIINTKYVTIEFILGYFDLGTIKYYDDIILNYVTQVLPSNTICNIKYTMFSRFGIGQMILKDNFIII